MRASVGVAPQRFIKASRLAVTTSAAQGPDVPCQGVLIKALGAGQTLYIDLYALANRITAANGFPMADGVMLDIPVSNLNQLDFIATAAMAVCFFPYFNN